MQMDVFNGVFKLKRPLVFFDLETTGTNVAKDRIVQIAITKIFPDGSKEFKNKYLNPTIPIPADASSIHNIYDEDVEDSPTFKNISKNLARFIRGCDFGGYNILKFDIPLLVEEFMRCEIDDVITPDTRFVDGYAIFSHFQPKTLAGAVKFYCDKEIINAHDAEADINQTIEVVEAQIARYEDLRGDVETLHNLNKKELVDFDGKIGKNQKGEYIYNIGKDRGKTVRSTPGFAEWMLSKDFTLDTKNWLRKILNNEV